MTVDHRFVLRPERKGIPPVINLDSRYKFVDALEQMLPEGPPSLLRCSKLTIEGTRAWPAPAHKCSITIDLHPRPLNSHSHLPQQRLHPTSTLPRPCLNRTRPCLTGKLIIAPGVIFEGEVKVVNTSPDVMLLATGKYSNQLVNL